MGYVVLTILGLIVGFILGVMTQRKNTETGDKLIDAYNNIKDIAMKIKK